MTGNILSKQIMRSSSILLIIKEMQVKMTWGTIYNFKIINCILQFKRVLLGVYESHSLSKEKTRQLLEELSKQARSP
jgi:hypothetical protein